MSVVAERAFAFALLVALLGPSQAAAGAEGQTPAGRRAETAAQSAMSGDELEKILPALDARDAHAREAANEALAQRGDAAVSAIARKLAELRKVPSAPVLLAVKLAKKTAGAPAADRDLHVALLDVHDDADAAAGATAARTTLSLARALSTIGTTSAARELVKLSGDHDGALRIEIARHVRSMGETAVPALIEARHAPSAATQRWAIAQLETMGKRIPSDAVQVTDPLVLAEVLRAYGRIRDLDALPALLSFVNADRPQVRASAREAVSSIGQDGIWKLREAYANLIGEPAPDTWTAAQVAKDLFAAQDRSRLREVHGLLDEGLERAKAGKPSEATAFFDRVLARQPMLDRRSEMAPAYLEHAASIEASDPRAAIAILQKARRLLVEDARSTDPRASRVEAQIAYLEALEARGRGVDDPAHYQHVLALDPTHTKARVELERIEATTADRTLRTRAIAAAVTTFLVGLIVLVMFVGTGRRQRGVTSRTS